MDRSSRGNEFLPAGSNAGIANPAERASGFDVCEVGQEEIERLSGRLDGVIWRSICARSAHPACIFMAFERKRPVASAVLFISEGLGSLRMALTAEPFCRGAQSALIVQRINKAGALGCKIVVFGNVVDPGAFTGQSAKSGFRNGLRERGI
jgi:hypothetical protein